MLFSATIIVLNKYKFIYNSSEIVAISVITYCPNSHSLEVQLLICVSSLNFF